METTASFRPVTGLVLALALTACGSTTATKALTVDQFIAEIDQLNGKTVMVTGFLGECEALSCPLYRSKAEAEEAGRTRSNIRAVIEGGATDVSGFPFPSHPAVSIGSGPQWSFFDLRAYFYRQSYVVITGRVNSRCRSKDVLCFDWADELEPLSLRSGTTPS